MIIGTKKIAQKSFCVCDFLNYKERNSGFSSLQFREEANKQISLLAKKLITALELA